MDNITPIKGIVSINNEEVQAAIIHERDRNRAMEDENMIILFDPLSFDIMTDPGLPSTDTDSMTYLIS